MYKEHMGLLYKERYPLCSEEIGKEKTAKEALPSIWNYINIPESPNINTTDHERCNTYCYLGTSTLQKMLEERSIYSPIKSELVPHYFIDMFALKL